MDTTAAVETFTALLTVVAAIGAVGVVVLVVVARRAPGSGAAALLDAIRASALWLAAAVASVATLGSLYFSEVANYVPCRLCWFQRVFMYPLAVILIVAAIRRDAGVRWYALPLAAIGAAISGYHYTMERFPSLESGSCEATGPLCSVPWFESFGFITLALMALVGFVTVGVLLFVARPYAGGVIGPDADADVASGRSAEHGLTAAADTAPSHAESSGSPSSSPASSSTAPSSTAPSSPSSSRPASAASSGQNGTDHHPDRQPVHQSNEQVAT